MKFAATLRGRASVPPDEPIESVWSCAPPEFTVTECECVPLEEMESECVWAPAVEVFSVVPLGTTDPPLHGTTEPGENPDNVYV